MRKTVERTICGHHYQVTAFGGRDGLELACRLSPYIAPVAEIIRGKGIKSLENLLESEIDPVPIIYGVVRELAQARSTMALICDLFSLTHRDRKDLSNEQTFDEVFSSNYGELIQAIKLIIEVNFPSFFELLTSSQPGDDETSPDENQES